MTDDASVPQAEYRRLAKTPPLNPLQAIKSVFSKYVSFGGRARRSEFWWFFLLVSLVYVAVVLTELHPVVLVALVLCLIPYLAVAVRRLHDTGRSGWWLLLNLVPLLGLLLIVWWCQDSDEDNQYGPYPKWAAP
jgi:uncharacterized membrane protein YhaH (DUF805 family)